MSVSHLTDENNFNMNQIVVRTISEIGYRERFFLHEI